MKTMDAIRAVLYSLGAVLIVHGVSEKQVDAYLSLVSAILVLAVLNVPLVKKLWQDFLRTRSE